MIKKELSSAIRSIVESLNLDWQNPPSLSQLTYQQKELFFQCLYQSNPEFSHLHYLAWNKLDNSQENETSSLADNAEVMGWVIQRERQHVHLTLNDKINLIQDSESIPKISQRELADKYKVGKSTVGDILRRKQDYLTQFENGSKRKRRLKRSYKFEKLNDTVFEWYSTSRANGFHIDGPLLKEKAIEISRDLLIDDFKASNGWLSRWRVKYSLNSFKMK